MFRSITKNKEGGGATTAGDVLRRSVNSLWTKCKKQATKASRKLASTTSSPRKLMSTISNIQFRHKKEEGVGKELWKKTILMGDKCEPLDFSGVIYYDSDGNQVDEWQGRSPRSPLPPSFDYFADEFAGRYRG